MLTKTLAAIAAAAFALTAPAYAQSDYPNRAVQIVVPFVAGGNTDLIARVLAEEFQTALKQPFTVVNKPGAGTNIGAATVTSSPPDGYTILLAPPAPYVVNQYIYKSLPFEPETAFAPVAMVARVPNVLVVPASLGIKSMQELIEKARSEPGKLDYASAGIGSTSHLAGALFNAMAKVQINHVPYRGTAQSVQDLIAGRVAMTIDNLGPILPFIQSGHLIALGVSTSERVPLLPDVPTIASLLEGFEISGWQALTVVAGTPKPIIDRLSEEANRIVAKPDVAAKLRTFGSEPFALGSEELAKFFALERPRWKRAVEAANIAPQ